MTGTASLQSTWMIRSERWASRSCANRSEVRRRSVKRVIGTLRRECLDWVIPLSEAHLRSILREWVSHYNGGRPHSALGPGIPGPPAALALGMKPESRHRWVPGAPVRVKSVLGGLHHEYGLVTGDGAGERVVRVDRIFR